MSSPKTNLKYSSTCSQKYKSGNTMKKFVSLLFSLTVMFSIMLLSACTELLPYNGYFDGGEILDDKLMSEIRSKYIVEESTESSTDKSSTSPLESETNIIPDISEDTHNHETECISNNSHETECISNTTHETETITNSTINDSDKATTIETKDNTENDSSIVFWTENGEVYHSKENCRYLKNKNYMTGTIQQAIESGKERLCSTCGK